MSFSKKFNFINYMYLHTVEYYAAKKLWWRRIMSPENVQNCKTLCANKLPFLFCKSLYAYKNSEKYI